MIPQLDLHSTFHNRRVALRCEYQFYRVKDQIFSSDISLLSRAHRCKVLCPIESNHTGRDTHNRTCFSCSLKKKRVVLKALLNKMGFRRALIINHCQLKLINSKLNSISYTISLIRMERKNSPAEYLQDCFFNLSTTLSAFQSATFFQDSLPSFSSLRATMIFQINSDRTEKSER